jgi:hypothetical protein
MWQPWQVLKSKEAESPKSLFRHSAWVRSIGKGIPVFDPASIRVFAGLVTLWQFPQIVELSWYGENSHA